jgi:hypothetical protein
MNIDNPGNFFDAENFPKDENEDSDQPIKVLGNLLFKKSIDILNITQTIGDLLAEDEDASAAFNLMMENALKIMVKVKSALSIDNVYSLVMENAVVIKINAKELLVQLWACETMHGLEKKYVTVLIDEMRMFKAIFIRWVQSFNKESDLPDDWYLFNDPNNFPSNDDE